MNFNYFNDSYDSIYVSFAGMADAVLHPLREARDSVVEVARHTIHKIAGVVQRLFTIVGAFAIGFAFGGTSMAGYMLVIQADRQSFGWISTLAGVAAGFACMVVVV